MTTGAIRTCVENANVFSTRTVDTFATLDFNFRMRKYAQCGPRLTNSCKGINIH